MGRFTCRACGTKSGQSYENRLCRPCEYVEREILVQEKSRTRRACRGCGKECPPDRYFKCHACQPNQHRPTDSAGDEFLPDTHIRGRTEMYQHSWGLDLEENLKEFFHE